MIQINTDVLKQIAATAKSATNELESATQILNQITTHNDWGCKERITINENIIRIKKNMLELRDSSTNFTSAVIQSAEEFAEVEKRIPDMFEGVESVLAKILSVTSPIVLGTPDFSTSAGFEDIFQDMNEYINITEYPSVAEIRADAYTAGGGGYASGGGGGGSFGGSGLR